MGGATKRSPKSIWGNAVVFPVSPRVITFFLDIDVLLNFYAHICAAFRADNSFVKRPKNHICAKAWAWIRKAFCAKCQRDRMEMYQRCEINIQPTRWVIREWGPLDQSSAGCAKKCLPSTKHFSAPVKKMFAPADVCCYRRRKRWLALASKSLVGKRKKMFARHQNWQSKHVTFFCTRIAAIPAAWLKICFLTSRLENMHWS